MGIQPKSFEEIPDEMVKQLSKALEVDMFAFSGRQHERGIINLLRKLNIKAAKDFHRPLVFEGLSLQR